MCRFPTLRPLWSALETNQFIHTVWMGLPFLDPANNDIFGTEQIQSMLGTNNTVTEFIMEIITPTLPHSFFAAVGAGSASNTTLKAVDIKESCPSEDGYFTALFQDRLDCKTGLEKLGLPVTDLNSVQSLVSYLNKMANTASPKLRADGSHLLSTLQKLRLYFHGASNAVECFKPVLDWLIRNSAYFELEELHLDCGSNPVPECDADFFNKLIKFIKGFPTVTVLRVRGHAMSVDDSKLADLADTLENSTTITELEVGDFEMTSLPQVMGGSDFPDNPNWARILDFVLQKRRGLRHLCDPSKENQFR